MYDNVRRGRWLGNLSRVSNLTGTVRVPYNASANLRASQKNASAASFLRSLAKFSVRVRELGLTVVDQTHPSLALTSNEEPLRPLDARFFQIR